MSNRAFIPAVDRAETLAELVIIYSITTQQFITGCSETYTDQIRFKNNLRDYLISLRECVTSVLPLPEASQKLRRIADGRTEVREAERPQTAMPTCTQRTRKRLRRRWPNRGPKCRAWSSRAR